MDWQVGSQVAKSRTFHVSKLRRVTKRSKTCVLILVPESKSEKVHASHHKLRQVHASEWPNETQVENLSRLVSPFGQGFMDISKFETIS